ncbi:MAG TPA: hypothetical protein [Caudoviricetes sp.]|nr:MAG TPA: hypothetical protein [Caudoviricetes sp.]
MKSTLSSPRRKAGALQQAVGSRPEGEHNFP